MGFIDIDLCTATDGTYLYAFAKAHEYDVYRPWDASNSPYHFILLKSIANPTNFQTAGWGFVASVPANNTIYTEVTPTTVCQVDSRGVVTLLVSSTGPAGSKKTENHTRGIQWDPAGSNTITNATGSGGWSILDSSGITHWDSLSASTLSTINSQTTLIFADYSYEWMLNFAVLSPATKTFTSQTTNWNLRTQKTSAIPDLLAYTNDKLYIVGSYIAIIIGQPDFDGGFMYLATMPLIFIGPAPATSQMRVSEYALPGLKSSRWECYPNHSNSFMSVLGNDLYILCTGNSTGTIYHHDGLNWTTPIVMPAVPWLSEQGRFVRSPGGQIWAFVRNYNHEIYTISISGNSANWTRAVDTVSISQTFGVYTGPTLTHSPTPQPTQGVSSGIGMNGGAIAGIVVGVLVVLFAAVFFIRARRKRGNGNKKELPSIPTEEAFQGKQEVDEITQEGPNSVTPVAQKVQYPYAAYDGTQSYPHYHQQVPMPSSTLPASQPYTVAQPYSSVPSDGVYPSQ
ncbi:hypothetical protein BGX26_000578 [Mortierella sp. AD094]|nr:hypothetical protein BGX26_000578 [Mortierella sp. AD094]